MEMNKFTTIDEYITGFPEEVQKILKKLREIIHAIAPEVQEKISYQMPTFVLHGNLVHFAAYKNHIGFYPGAHGVESFQEELKDYKTSKGTIQFPINQPLPLELIERIVRFKVEVNKEKSALKTKNKIKTSDSK